MASNARKTIGINPLDAVVPDLRSLRAAPEPAAAPAPPPEPVAAPPKPVTVEAPVVAETVATVEEEAAPASGVRKERLTIHLPIDLIDRVKNAVFWTPGLTLAELGEQALTQFLDQLEAERGAPYETRLAELKGGRPVKR